MLDTNTLMVEDSRRLVLKAEKERIEKELKGIESGMKDALREAGGTILLPNGIQLNLTIQTRSAYSVPESIYEVMRRKALR